MIGFQELQFPQINTPVTGELQWYVGVDELGPYLWDDGNLKELPYMFDSYEDAIVASANYYHRNGWLYPRQMELDAVCKSINIKWHNDKRTKSESHIMEFI